jgi:NitT/TauT family transport system ATP-binding protein
MSAVTVEKLEKFYDGLPIIEGLDLDIASGSFVTIVGASGCGKSTFLRMLLGQEQPTRGQILVDGEPLPPEPGPERGIVFQRYSVFPHLTVLDNVVLGLEFKAAPWTSRLFGAERRRGEQEADQMIEAVGLNHVRDARPASLSGGMQQRLAIAQALILKPKILLLDEPFGALDPGIRDDMHALITELWHETGMTVFMVTHDLKEAFKLGTRVLTFDKVRHDPHAPEAYGATITYDLQGRQRQRDAAGVTLTEPGYQDGAIDEHQPDPTAISSP